MSQHVHLGAGKRGLAFPVAVSKKWAFTRTLILNRTGTDSLSVKRNSALRDNHRYFIKYFGSSDLHRINYDAFTEYEDSSVLSSTAIAAIANPDTVLVTTAVREANLERIAPLIAEASSHRVRGRRNISKSPC